jgi:PST family polysaccharide transporter
MNLYKVSFISAVETIIKLIAGILMVKILANYDGPEGVAKLGHFQNLFTILSTIVIGGIATAVVKNSSNYSINNGFLIKYLTTAIFFGFFAAALLAIYLFFNASQLSQNIFESPKLLGIFYLLAVTLFFTVLYQSAISYLNGLRMIKEMVLLKITNSTFLIFASILLIPFYGLIGSLISLFCAQIISGLLGLYFLISHLDFSLLSKKLLGNKKIQLELFFYWLMNTVSLISSAIVLMLIRSRIVEAKGWLDAGLWEAVWRTCDLSLLLVTTSLTVYFLPTLSSTKDKKDELKLIFDVLVLAISIAILISLTVYLFRSFLIGLLFSNEFESIQEILTYQLLGAVLKVIAWVIGFHMLIKSRPIFYLFSEVFFGFSFLLLSTYSYDSYGIKGLTYAYALNNFFFVIVGFLYLKNYFKKQ